MRSTDLATLVLLIGAVGSLDLGEFRRVFELTNPDDVHAWVDQFKSTNENKRTALTLPLFLQALEAIGYSAPNAVNAAVIAHEVSRITNRATQPQVADVMAIVHGLTVLVPHLIRSTQSRDIYFSTSPKGLRDALAKQIQRIPADYRVGYMRTFAPPTAQ